MVAASTLNQTDQHLFTAYVAVRFNLIDLVGHVKQPLIFLQDWALQPHIRDQVRRYRVLEKLQHQTETTDARSAGIAALLELLNNSEDPIERRRAAQTLIRVGAPDPAPRSPRPPGPTQPSRAAIDTDNLDHAHDLVDLNSSGALDDELDEELDQDLDEDQDLDANAEEDLDSELSDPAQSAPAHSLPQAPAALGTTLNGAGP